MPGFLSQLLAEGFGQDFHSGWDSCLWGSLEPGEGGLWSLRPGSPDCPWDRILATGSAVADAGRPHRPLLFPVCCVPGSLSLGPSVLGELLQHLAAQGLSA